MFDVPPVWPSWKSTAGFPVARQKLEFGVWRLEIGVWRLEFRVWSLEFGDWSLEIGVWEIGDWRECRSNSFEMTFFFS